MIKLNLAHFWQFMTQNLWAQHTSAQKLFEAVFKPSRATVKTLAKKSPKRLQNGQPWSRQRASRLNDAAKGKESESYHAFNADMSQGLELDNA